MLQLTEVLDTAAENHIAVQHSCHECSGLLARMCNCAPLPLQLLLRVIKLQQQKLSSAVCGIALHCSALHVEQITGQELHCKRYICSALHTDETAEKRASADITGVQRPIALQRYV